MNALYDIELTTIDGRRQTRRLRRQTLLVVNVASRCGFTPLYGGLEALWRRYREPRPRRPGLSLRPVRPSGAGRRGEDQGISAAETYEVTFPLFAKIEVNGKGAHPLYRALKSAAPGLLGTRAIKWNFTKFLIDGRGAVVRRYAPIDKPESLARDIEALLN